MKEGRFRRSGVIDPLIYGGTVPATAMLLSHNVFPEFVAWQVAGNNSETSLSAGERQRDHLIDRFVFRR